MDSPYAEVMRAALEAVDRGFTFDSVIRYLRALPRTEEEAGEIDLLDNYLRKTGIRGYKRFSTPWAALPSTEPGKKDTDEKQVDPKLQQLEVIRQKYIAPLLQLYDDTKERSCPVQTRVAGLRALLATLDARAAVEKLSEDIRAHGDQNRAEILARGLDTIDDVLDKCEELLGDSAVSRTEFRDILDAGLSEESVRVIPATLDQVEIGDLTRSRFDSPKRFFIAGLTADQVPKAEADDKLLTDRDRALFTEKLSLEVAPDRTENALEQRFYIYMALLNASGKLYLSFPVKGRDGKGLKPSGVLKDIENMFADLKVTRFHTGDAEIYTERELLRYTAEGLSDIHEGRSRQSLDLENFGKAIALLLKNPETKRKRRASFVPQGNIIQRRSFRRPLPESCTAKCCPEVSPGWKLSGCAHTAIFYSTDSDFRSGRPTRCRRMISEICTTRRSSISFVPYPRTRLPSATIRRRSSDS